MCKKSQWRTSACNMTRKKSTEKNKKSCERWRLCLIFGSMSSPPSLGMWHSVTSTESQKTWTTIAAVWKPTHVPTLTEWFQKMWEILLMEKLIHTILPTPKVRQTKPLLYTSLFGICLLNMPGTNKQYSWPYFYQENKMQYLRIKLMKNKFHNTPCSE